MRIHAIIVERCDTQPLISLYLKHDQNANFSSKQIYTKEHELFKHSNMKIVKHKLYIENTELSTTDRTKLIIFISVSLFILLDS